MINFILGFVFGFIGCILLIAELIRRRMLGYMYLDITEGSIKLHMTDYPKKGATLAIFRIYSQNISSPK